MMIQGTARVRQDGAYVILNFGTKEVILPSQAAAELAKAVGECAKHAKIVENLDQVVADEAILRRTGAPLTLSGGNPKVQALASQEAQWGPLRRYIDASPHARKDKEYVAAPSVRVEAPQ